MQLQKHPQKKLLRQRELSQVSLSRGGKKKERKKKKRRQDRFRSLKNCSPGCCHWRILSILASGFDGKRRNDEIGVGLKEESFKSY